MRLGREDARAIAEVKDLLATHVDGGPSALDVAMPAIARLIGSDKWAAYTIDPRGERLRAKRLIGNGFDVAGVTRDLNALIASQAPGWAPYDPFRPQPDQRNVAIDAVRWVGWEGMREYPIVKQLFAKHGLAENDQLRALVCEGGTLLAYVGGWRPGEVYTHRERHLLQAVVPALRRALLLERRLANAPFFEAAFAAALEALPAAFVLSKSGAVLHVNAAARRLLETGDAPPLGEVVRGRVPDWELHPIRAAGVPDAFLAVRRPGEPRLSDLIARAVRRHGLTPRQAEVLALLAEGLTYEAMSARLCCSVKTIESHVSAVLDKLDVGSRSEAIAQLWRMA